MTQYRNLTYADSARLAAEEEKRQQEAAARVNLASEDEQEEFMNLQAKLDAGEISQAEFDTLNPLMRGVERQQTRKYTFDQEEIGINEDDILEELTDESYINHLNEFIWKILIINMLMNMNSTLTVSLLLNKFVN